MQARGTARMTAATGHATTVVDITDTATTVGATVTAMAITAAVGTDIEADRITASAADMAADTEGGTAATGIVAVTVRTAAEATVADTATEVVDTTEVAVMAVAASMAEEVTAAVDSPLRS